MHLLDRFSLTASVCNNVSLYISVLLQIKMEQQRVQLENSLKEINEVKRKLQQNVSEVSNHNIRSGNNEIDTDYEI